ICIKSFYGTAIDHYNRACVLRKCRQVSENIRNSVIPCFTIGTLHFQKVDKRCFIFKKLLVTGDPTQTYTWENIPAIVWRKPYRSIPTRSYFHEVAIFVGVITTEDIASFRFRSTCTTCWGNPIFIFGTSVINFLNQRNGEVACSRRENITVPT